MAVFLVVGTIAGVMLGLRFRVLILGPASLLATAVITVSGFVSGHEPRMIALTVFGAVASLQIGYLVGGILLARTVVRYRPSEGEVVLVDVELENAGVAHFELCEQEQRHDEHSDAVIARDGATP
jgi:hypothetical protein